MCQWAFLAPGEGKKVAKPKVSAATFPLLLYLERDQYSSSGAARSTTSRCTIVPYSCSPSSMSACGKGAGWGCDSTACVMGACLIGLQAGR
ncbi:hypothetical protein ASA_1516 [Aeromonas salmonicida subsp. salmonicida A449]|uniref:Uncharacterized protein n=1 Tax=Aeromonas salmonicida (strain A449) TaxID=382245 RepID=A4SL34_AERS4|nr:hypothetical protein ASA_1516 [Aeromonas salmonicida subsp. salmonicida A449]